MMEKVTDEMLMAFVDGETDAATAAMVEKALAADPGLALRAQDFRRSKALLRDAFGDVRREPVPEALLAAVVRADQAGTIVAFPYRHKLRFALPLAASLAVAFGVAGYFVGQTTPDTDDLLGHAAIADALGETVSGDSRTLKLASGDALLRTLATYRIEGGICRSFDLSGSDIALTGVGCDRGAGWNVDLTVAQASNNGLYAPASGAALSSIDAYLDALEASAALTRQEEEDVTGR
jgi:hypothetical protein